MIVHGHGFYTNPTMNKARYTFMVMGLIAAVLYVVLRIINSPGSEFVLMFVAAFFLVAFSIRLLGYLLKRDKIRGTKY